MVPRSSIPITSPRGLSALCWLIPLCAGTSSLRAFVPEAPSGIPLHWLDQNPSTPNVIDIWYDFRPITNGNTTYPNSITGAEQALAIQALGDWSAVTGSHILFTQNTSAASTSIVNISHGDLAAVGATSGVGGTLGRTTYSYFLDDGSFNGASVQMDQADSWDLTVGNGNPSFSTNDFYSVVFHEIGHGLGLDHSNAPVSNMMTAAYQGEKLGPSTDDINGMNYLYNGTAAYTAVTRNLPSFVIDFGAYYDYFFGSPSSTLVYRTDSGTTTIAGDTNIRHGFEFHCGGGIWNTATLTVGDNANGAGLCELYGTGQLTAGTLTVSNNSSLFQQTGGVLALTALSQTGGTISLGGPQALYNFPSVAVSNGGKLILTADAAKALKTNTVPVVNAGGFGQLDLVTNKLIVQSTDSTNKTTMINAINTAITSGAAPSGGVPTWTGNGITSSTAALDPNHYGVGVFDNAILNKTSFGGQPTDTNSIFVTIAHLGDTNHNGIVDIQDISVVANNWQQNRNNWTRGDLNRDGVVNIQDASIVANNWQQTSIYSLTASWGSGGDSMMSFGPPSPAPEPASVLVLGALVPLLLRRRRS